MTDIDQILCNFIDRFIETHSPKLNNSNIQRQYLIAFGLQEIYGYSTKDLLRKLNNESELPEEVEDLAGEKYHHISKKRRELKNSDEELLNDLRTLSSRIVYILYYDEDVDLPEEALEAYDLKNGLDIDTETKKEEARNWAEDLVGEILAPLTFSRTDPEYEYKRYIGLSAHSALQNIAPNDAANTASYLYDPDNIPSGSSLRTNITEFATEYENKYEENYLPKELIEKLQSGTNNFNRSVSGSDNLDKYLPRRLVNQFVRCYQNFFEYASDLGFLEGEQVIAIDATKDPTTKEGGKDTPLATKAESPQKSDEYGKYGWLYQFLAMTNSESPFIWNISPIYNRSELQLRMAKQLEALTTLTNVNIDFSLVDRGYYKADVVEVCRHYMDEDWAINAKEKGDMKKLFDQAQQGEIVPGKIDFASMNKSPRAFVYPNVNMPVEELDIQLRFDNIKQMDDEIITNPKDSELYYRTSLSSEEEDRTHTGYLTDKRLTEKNIRKIHALYQRRDTIEPIVGQVKDTMMPYCESPDTAVRYYFIALGGLFYNMHALTKRALSPEHGIPLDISGKEMLSAIRDVCLK